MNRRTLAPLPFACLSLVLLGCASPCQDDGLNQEACDIAGESSADTDTDSESGGPGPGIGQESDDGSDSAASNTSPTPTTDGESGDTDDSDTSPVDTSGDSMTAADETDTTDSDSGDSAESSSGGDSEGDSEGTSGGPADEDDDGVPDDEDNCPTLANGDQSDIDADAMGDVCDTNTACGPGLEWTPVIGAGVTVESGQWGLCLDCMVEDEELVADLDLSNHARMVTPLGVAGANFVTVFSGELHDAGTRVGFVLENPNGVLTVDLLSGLSLTTYLDDGPREIAGAAGLLGLDVLDIGDGSGNVLVGFQTSADFDAVRVSGGSVVGALSELSVVVACVDSNGAGS